MTRIQVEPVRRSARFRVRAGEVERARAAMRELVERVAGDEPGTLRFEAHAEPGGDRFLFVMEFAGTEALEQHRRAPHVRRFLEAVHPLCAEPPEVLPLEAVAVTGAPGIAVRSVRQVERLPAPPERVWRALMDPAEHAAFTGMAAEIEPRAGGRFVTCGGLNFGWNLALAPGRIVQAWSHRDFPDDHYSVATFDLAPLGDETRLEFTQLGVPVAAFGWIEPGWRETYWAPLKRYLVDR